MKNLRERVEARFRDLERVCESTTKNMKPLKPKHCAVRQHVDNQPDGRCWHPVGDRGHCPVHGDVSGVQFRFRETGELTNDFDLMWLRRRKPLAQGGVLPDYGSDKWVERFRRANPRAEVVGFRGRNVLVKLKTAANDFPRIYQVVGGTPEAPTLQEYA